MKRRHTFSIRQDAALAHRPGTRGFEDLPPPWVTLQLQYYFPSLLQRRRLYMPKCYYAGTDNVVSVSGRSEQSGLDDTSTSNGLGTNRSASFAWGHNIPPTQARSVEWMMLPSKPRSIVLPARTYFSFRFERMVGRIIAKFRDAGACASGPGVGPGDATGVGDGEGHSGSQGTTAALNQDGIASGSGGGDEDCGGEWSLLLRDSQFYGDFFLRLVDCLYRYPTISSIVFVNRSKEHSRNVPPSLSPSSSSTSSSAAAAAVAAAAPLLGPTCEKNADSDQAFAHLLSDLPPHLRWCTFDNVISKRGVGSIALILETKRDNSLIGLALRNHGFTLTDLEPMVKYLRKCCSRSNDEVNRYVCHHVGESHF
jgi:hypothetical protein